jgi:hypothetical protein
VQQVSEEAGLQPERQSGVLPEMRKIWKESIYDNLFFSS